MPLYEVRRNIGAGVPNRDFGVRWVQPRMRWMLKFRLRSSGPRYRAHSSGNGMLKHRPDICVGHRYRRGEQSAGIQCEPIDDTAAEVQLPITDET